MPEGINVIKTKNKGFLIDTGIVCISIKDYKELVSAAAKLDVVKSMYLNSENSYHYDEVLSSIFGEKGENEDAE